ncbi:MAG: N-acyl homoserine lactonase family protein [Lautropia sp.]|nr:N-acyl homoserine lactonase family protein [Lautropia sp.]
MSDIRLHPIQTGDVQIKSRHQVARFRKRPARVFDVLIDPHWSPRLPIGCYLIEHPEGLIVVDTGESAHANDKGYQPWWHPFMQFCERRWVKPEEEVGERIRALGLDPHRVKWVVMTHMHGDHAGGIHHFPHSEFVLSHTEKEACLASNGPMQGYLNMHYPKWFNPSGISFDDGPFESFASSRKLTADGRIRLVPTPGHTLGHLSVIIDQGEHYVLLAGDAAYTEAAMLRGEVDGVAIDADLHNDSTRRMRELCSRKPTITQFAHDENSGHRLKNRIFTTIS